MRRRGEGGAEEAKVVIQKGFQTKQKKNYRAALSAFLSHDLWVGRSSLSSCLFAEKKNSLSLSLLFCRPPPHCVKANNNTKR